MKESNAVTPRVPAVGRLVKALSPLYGGIVYIVERRLTTSIDADPVLLEKHLSQSDHEGFLLIVLDDLTETATNYQIS